ncbi:low molecular weight protein-tyrosine-phosphatase [Pedobacter cryoconitis]|uniref:protein-tyrosine-phosphatase n=1 Tax=Pedobacter cryoconitis TaxID=188932 RepID=A0A327SCB5_9SPHI|nr:low molecular weight protein-tyrosine-phosphatase [Pedobacter cryoconitis]RAJ25564.1 protein-tyrosine phosphatase [Pedobacter cryoconitis]
MKILMVCLGNICRSPLAEGIVRQLIAEKELDWEVASAGTGNWHTGQPADKRSIAIAKNYGYDISRQRARLFGQELFDEFDHILVMDKNNLRDVLKLAANEEHRQKVRLFLTDEDEVTDPYFDDQLFDPVFLTIEKRAKNLIEELKK